MHFKRSKMHQFSTQLFLLTFLVNCCVFTFSSSEEDDGEVQIIDIDEMRESLEEFVTSSPLAPTQSSQLPNDDDTPGLPSQDDLITNNTRCSLTHLSFTKETLLHVWEIKGLIGYISYIKRFEQPFEVKTDQVSFKSDNVDGKWMFKVHKVRHLSPFSVRSSSSATASATSSNYAPHSNEIGDIRIVVTYSYEAKQPRNIDFILKPTIIHGSKEIALPAKRSTSPTIVQQKFYNNRGFQLNSNFLEYVYTFTWSNVMQPLNNIKSNLINTKFRLEDDVSVEGQPDIPQKQQPAYYVYGSDNAIDEGSEELFEEITKTDFSGHFGDVTIKFVISAFFPEEPVSFTSSRCNASVMDLVNYNLLEKLTMSSKQTVSPSSGGGYFGKDLKQNRVIGHGVPPYMRYLYSMLHDDRFADVILVVGQDELPAHRIILATSSPVFSAILENGTAIYSHGAALPLNENLTDCELIKTPEPLPRIIIEPRDIGLDTVQEFLRYIYTGSVDNFKMKGSSITRRLIQIADKYDLPELKRHCEIVLLEELNVDNAIEMYLLGARIHSEKITRKALIVMKLNKAKIASQTEEFRELSMRHPTLMYDLFLSD